MTEPSQSCNVKGLIVFFVNDSFDDEKYNVSQNESDIDAFVTELKTENDCEVQRYFNLTIGQLMERVDSVAKKDYGKDSSLTLIIKSHCKNSNEAMARDGWYDLSKLSEILELDSSSWEGKPTQLLLQSYDDDEEEKGKEMDLSDGIVSKLVLCGFKKVSKIKKGTKLSTTIKGIVSKGKKK